jgi:hypothetical protein
MCSDPVSYSRAYRVVCPEDSVCWRASLNGGASISHFRTMLLAENRTRLADKEAKDTRVIRSYAR